MKEHAVAASKSAREILEAVVEDGREELNRVSVGLAFLIPAAGLTHCIGWRRPGSSEFLINVFSGKET